LKVQVLSEISSAKGVIPAGQIINISAELLGKLKGKVKPIIWCQSGDCHCSGMLPQNHYPAECLRIICQHYTP